MECEGKEAHTYKVAKKIAREMNRRGGRFRKLNPYKCTVCGQWHVGGSDRKRKRF